MMLFSSASLGLLIQVILISLIARIIVVYRWWILLSGEKQLKISQVFHYINIGYFINSLLPARTGDFFKAVMIAEKNGIGRTSCLASVALERLFDLLGLSIVFVTSFFVLDLPLYIKRGGVIILLLALVLFIMIILLSKHSKAFYYHFSGFSKKKVYLWLIRRFELVFSYSYILHNKRIVSGVLAATVLIWFFYIYAGYIIVEKIAPTPYSWNVSLLALLFISISFVLPATPGNIGVYQFACVLAFSVEELSREQAIVFSLISQIPVYFLSILLGLYSMSCVGVKARSIKDQVNDSPE